MSASSVSRSCMRDHIRQAIVDRMLDGSYPPGTRLKELALAQEFNVSQAPIREALRELESMGLVETLRYKGTYVRTVTPEETQEAYELRACLEEAAARLAVPASAKDLKLLQQDVDQIVAAARKNDMKAYARSNLSFHRRIIAMSGNGTMLRVWDSLGWEVLSRQRLQAAHRHPRFLNAVKAHQEILDHLARGEGAEAGRLLREHTEAFKEEEA